MMDQACNFAVALLREAGVDKVFGIPGGACAPMLKALLDAPDMRFVVAKQETNAAFMAMGYSLATRRPGVVVTTAGPGVTNTLTGLASAYYEHLPIVHISGEVPTTAFGRNALQESSAYGLNVSALVSGITKFAAQITRPDAVASATRRALVTAQSGVPGPVFLSLPLNVAAAESKATAYAGRVETTFHVDERACASVADLLASAKRPLIVVGADGQAAPVRQSVLQMSERLCVPVAATPRGKGAFPEDHRNYLGLFGFGGHESVVEYLEGGTDVLIVAGCRLDDFSTNAWSPLLRSSTAFVHIGRELCRLGNNYSTDIGLVGPVDVVLDEIARHIDAKRITREVCWPAIRYQPVADAASGLMTTAQVARTLGDVCPDNAVFTADMGEHLGAALHYLRIGRRATFFTALGLGSMGSGPTVAIGHQIGDPSRPVFAICGDGGFLMCGTELATAVKHRVPVTILVMNDSRLSMCHHGMSDLYGASNDFTTQEIDFAALAQALGARGTVVRTRAELVAELARPTVEPRLLDVRVDGNARLLGGSQRNAALKHFTE